MITPNTIKNATKVDVLITEKMVTALVKWINMYLDTPPWKGGSAGIKTLQLPAAIAGEIARAVTIEMEVETTGSPRADYINEAMKPVIKHIRKNIEYGCAHGGIMFKPYNSENGIGVDYPQADQFYPVAFDANGNMTSCIFTDQRVIGQFVYTRVEFHRMLPRKVYTITNQVYRSTSKADLGSLVSFDSVADWAGLEPETTIVGIEKPLFAYFKYPLANNVDPSSPLGVSCYSRAVDLIQQADQQWTDLLLEFETGKRALYVDELAFGRDLHNNPILPNKRLYRTLKTAGDINGKHEMFEDFTPSIREANILAGLDAMLKRIEFTCGLSYGTLSDPQNVALTATEIKTSKQREYATITDTQKALQETLDHLQYAIDIFVTLGNLAPKGSYETTYWFDDSIVTDHDTQFTQDMQALDRVMSRVEFRMRNYGESEAVAKEKLALLTAEQKVQADFFGTEEAFV